MSSVGCCANESNECVRSIEFDIITTLWLLQLVCAFYFPFSYWLFFSFCFVLTVCVRCAVSVCVCVCKERNGIRRTSKWEQKYDSEYFGHSFFAFSHFGHCDAADTQNGFVVLSLVLSVCFFFFLRANKSRRTQHFLEANLLSRTRIGKRKPKCGPFTNVTI